MITTERTNSDNPAFQHLAGELEMELKIRDGEDHLFYAQLNKIDKLEHVIVAYSGNEPVGCGGLRSYSQDLMEVKRMYVAPGRRMQGIASLVLKELESWCKELMYKKCILETGKNQPEAIHFYKKNGYISIPNFGHYTNAANSLCFEKEMI